MSSSETTDTETETPIDEANLEEMNEKQKKISEHLVDEVQENDGDLFTRSKEIGRAVGLSAKEVGTNLKIASENLDCLSIDKWAKCSSTTWKITPQDDEDQTEDTED
jgi:hypothetical protein